MDEAKFRICVVLIAAGFLIMYVAVSLVEIGFFWQLMISLQEVGTGLEKLSKRGLF